MNVLVERLGWLLVHSLWQFALVALLAGIVSRALRRNSAAARYGVFVAAMTVMVAAPVTTWFMLPANVLASRGASAPGQEADATVRPGADALRLVGHPVEGAHDTMRSVAPSTVNDVGWDSVPTGVGLNAVVGMESQPTTAIIETAWSEHAAAFLRPWFTWIVAAWIIGVVLCSLRPLLGWRTLWRLKRVGVSPVSEDVLAAMSRVSRRLGFVRGARFHRAGAEHVENVLHVWQSTLAQVPVVVGYCKPVILLPVSLATSLSVEQLEAILAHELAHIRRHDFVVNLLQTLVETLFFYHPAVWWLSRQIRIEREHCCDDLVVRVLGNRVEYGRALVAVEELRGRASLLALGAADGSLLARVRRIVGIAPEFASQRACDRWPIAFAGFVTVSLVLTLARGAFVSSHAENDKPIADRDINASAAREPRRTRPIAKEMQPFQGTWKMDLCDSANRTMHAPQQEVWKWRWTVKGNEVVWGRQGEEWKLTLRVDPSKSPKEIDFTYLSGPFKGETCLGMYEFGGTDGKSLRISIHDPGAKVARPKDISMTGTSQNSLIFLRPTEPIDPAQELASLQGTWTFKIVQTDAWPKPIGKGPDKNGQGSERRWIIQGNEITWTSPAGEEVKASFTIDPQKVPRQIDLTFLSGPHKGEKCPGVCEWVSDEHKFLWMCFADPGSKAARPINISYSTDEGRSMIGLSAFSPSPSDQATDEADARPVPLEFRIAINLAESDAEPRVPKRAQLAATATVEKAEIMVGEPTWMAFKVTNQSDKNLRLMVGGDYRNRLGRPESFSVDVFDAAGKKVPQPDAGGTMGGISVAQPLKANGGESPFELFLPHWATIAQPGRYRIVIRRKCELVPDDGTDAFRAKTEKVAVAAETTLNVVPADAAKFGELIEQLGAKLLGENSADSERASKMLRAMRDERIVPWFVKLLDQPSGPRKLIACDGLAQYGSDAAFAALQNAMKTTSADIRVHDTTTHAQAEEWADQVHHAASAALAKNPHPDAASFLLAQANDRYWGTRITVLHFAATLKSNAARDVIERLTNDENEAVRNEAHRYLKEAKPD